MPKRTLDDQALWTYPTTMPSMNTKLNKHAISLPDLVESTGIDGRFIGALRPFPGMADESVHKVPKPEAGHTITTAFANIVLVRYVSIQKGNSGEVLKGLAILADNQGGTGKSLYFSYWDTGTGTSDVVELEDYDSWDDFSVTSYNQFDITSLGRYIYVCISGDTTSNVTQWTNKENPYNKAYFWDFKLNTWDKFVTGMTGRFMGLQPRRQLGHPLQADDDGTFVGDSEDAYDTQVYNPPIHSTPGGDYAYAAELVSRKHKLRSYLRLRAKNSDGTPTQALNFVISMMNLPADQVGATHQIKGNTHESTCIINWGIPHVDGFRLWRTPVNSTGAAFDKYTPIGGNLYLVNEYVEKGSYVTTTVVLTRQIDHDSDIGTITNDAKSRYFDDASLIQQIPQYNAFLHAFNPAPRFKRLVAYDGTLVGVTDIEEPASPDKDWDDLERIPEAIVWSVITADEPENFPPENYYRADSASERFLALEPSGDHLFAVTNAGVYRVTRGASNLTTNRLQFRLGGVSRFGQTGVGNSLFIVTASGLKQIDGNTGAINSVTNMDRVLLDDSEWASTLSSIQIEFDAKAGVLVMLNTAKQEAYLLWEASGAVTKLEDMIWTHITSGPEVGVDGSSRVFFVADNGAVHTIDSSREMAGRSMCGLLSGETSNGTFTAGTTTTNMADSAATFPTGCATFRMYILSGDLEGTSAVITSRDNATQLTVPALSGTPAEGDRYSISPVVTRVVLPAIVGEAGRPDPFNRKTTVTFAASFSDLGGETGTSDTNGKFTYGVKQMEVTLGTVESNFNIVPDKTVAALNRAGTRLFPFLEFKGGNQDWELQAVQVKGTQGISENQSRQGTT